jgi:hypothetical protein
MPPVTGRMPAFQGPDALDTLHSRSQASARPGRNQGVPERSADREDSRFPDRPAPGGIPVNTRFQFRIVHFNDTAGTPWAQPAGAASPGSRPREHHVEAKCLHFLQIMQDFFA